MATTKTTKETESTDPAKTKMTALEPILHDGKTVLPGENFEADTGQVERLEKNKRAKKA